MADIITVTLRLFGAFREHGEQLHLSLPAGSTVSAVKSALARQLPQEAALIADSALADDSSVLAEDAPLSAHATLAILPPVCGG